MSKRPHTIESTREMELERLHSRDNEGGSATVQTKTPLRQVHISQKMRKRELSKQWIWEILSISGALLLFCTIIGVLTQYNHDKQPAWKYSMNLNSLVALISTLFKALMMVAVAEVISQCKWLWYQKPYSMDQMSTFDSASRGVWGSLNLVVKIPRSKTALLAAIITIISVGINTFTQQSIKTYQCTKPIPGGAATIPVANAVSNAGGDTATLDSYLGVGLTIKIKTRITNALANSDANMDVPVSCPTGNCTFEDNGGIYNSTGLCHRCWNVAGNLTDVYSNNTLHWSKLSNNVTVGWTRLENNSVLNVSTSAKVVFPMDDAPTADMLAASIRNMTILAKTRLPCKEAGGHEHPFSNDSSLCYLATSCMLYPCLKSYSGRIELGQLSETIESTTPMLKTNEASVSDSAGVRWPCRADGQIYDEKNISTATSRNQTALTAVRITNNTVIQVPPQCVHTMGWSWRMAIASFFEYFMGGCTENRGNPNSLSCTGQTNVELFYNGGNATYQTIEAGVERMVRVITNRIREHGVLSNKPDSERSVATGIVQETFICTRFVWYWLLVPAILLVTSMVLLATVVLGGLYDRQSHPIWKSSVFPLLLHGPYSGGEDADKVGDRMAEMAMAAERTVVTLREDDNGTWKLLQDSEVASMSRVS